MCALYVRTSVKALGKNDLPRSFRYEVPPVLLGQSVEHYPPTAQTAAPEDGNVTVEYPDQIALTQKEFSAKRQTVQKSAASAGASQLDWTENGQTIRPREYRSCSVATMGRCGR